MSPFQDYGEPVFEPTPIPDFWMGFAAGVALTLASAVLVVLVALN